MTGCGYQVGCAARRFVNGYLLERRLLPPPNPAPHCGPPVRPKLARSRRSGLPSPSAAFAAYESLQTKFHCGLALLM